MRTASALHAVIALVAVAAWPVSASASDCAMHGTCCFAREQKLPLRSAAHRAVVGAPVTEPGGGLARPVVKRYLSRHALELASCYPRLSVAANSGIVIAIAPTGRAQLANSVGFSDEVVGCMTRVVEHATFPRATTPTRAFVPITFAR